MDVILYKNSAPPNKINKTSSLTQKTTIENVRFFDDGALSVLNPILLLNISTEVSDIVKYNYVRIPKFDRYYYIDSVETEGGLFKITCRCDPLMSHQKDILNSTQYILRSETLRSPYLVDNQIPIRSDKRLHQVVFGDNVDNKQCPYVILETTGKGGVPV